jgi:thiamine biosynthesis protein ThiS
MQIKVNGQLQQFEGSLSVLALAQKLDLNPKQVAIERNCEIVPRSRFAEVVLSDGDAIEIVHFIGGG